MSLNWKHSDHTRADWDELQSTTREVLIFRTMTVGMNRITEANVEEFFLRNYEVRAVIGGVKLTLDECRAAIGLSTNASDLTPTRFRKALTDHLRGNAEYALRSAKAETN